MTDPTPAPLIDPVDALAATDARDALLKALAD